MGHEFAVRDSRLLIDAPILAVRRDAVTMPGGEVANREIVEHFGAVAVVAYDRQRDAIAMVHQYRHAVGRHLWELPAGILDVAGESALDTAKRELQEEVGLAAQTWSVLVDLVTSPGVCDEAVRVFVAQDLSAVEQPVPQEEEAEMTMQWVELSAARDMVFSGQLHNSIAVAGVLSAWAVLRDGASARPVDTPFDLRPTALAGRRQAAGVPAGADMKRP
ncbi:NUDIX domain-containing protein [Corynebacterium uberis]|uniref:NUDIX domain-containing protein n=1 Tax=Corynebacterium TaxID=1716 RepID=UPI001D0B9C39|nr:NUDIX hydrolase [Corynebacterium uberis]MCZ9308717.1 NUDIX hydrolase [Corynebacterium sp. c6VSa_13]UDL74352.1 NUDIX hydrolase [Corynebacterium uberis]UDL76815.1 NUDIX hydrolase [Corynebacterium uberis]UDL79028.1 NUDIX hydrolase [Corynebacterium uberis]UDL79266.1 NUDIX hydrolase [Corynebacterium uberis]